MPLSDSKSKVCFFFEKKNISLKNRSLLKAFIEGIFKTERRSLSSINYIFCSDKKILDVNRRFLKHNYYTDIITFDLSETKSIEAEIYISIDRVRDNSKKLGTGLSEELHRVIFHGALHLCGYTDDTRSSKHIIREKENLYLKKYFGQTS